MQLLGLALVFVVVIVGFMEREMTQVRTFDGHALFIILAGCVAAILIASSRRVALRSLTVLREFVPGLGSYVKQTASSTEAFDSVYSLYTSGRRAEAIQKAESSGVPALEQFINTVVARGSDEVIQVVFHDLKATEIEQMQPLHQNWEMLSKLSPSFGMVGTITGMIQLFQALGSDDANIGAAMSLALLATLYGIAFGAGIAGPIGHRLEVLLDERLGLLDRMENAARQLSATSGGGRTS